MSTGFQDTDTISERIKSLSNNLIWGYNEAPKY